MSHLHSPNEIISVPRYSTFHTVTSKLTSTKTSFFQITLRTTTKNVSLDLSPCLKKKNSLIQTWVLLIPSLLFFIKHFTYSSQQQNRRMVVLGQVEGPESPRSLLWSWWTLGKGMQEIPKPDDPSFHFLFQISTEPSIWRYSKPERAFLSFFIDP